MPNLPTGGHFCHHHSSLRHQLFVQGNTTTYIFCMFCTQTRKREKDPYQINASLFQSPVQHIEAGKHRDRLCSCSPRKFKQFFFDDQKRTSIFVFQMNCFTRCQQFFAKREYANLFVASGRRSDESPQTVPWSFKLIGTTKHECSGQMCPSNSCLVLLIRP